MLCKMEAHTKWRAGCSVAGDLMDLMSAYNPVRIRSHGRPRLSLLHRDISMRQGSTTMLSFQIYVSLCQFGFVEERCVASTGIRSDSELKHGGATTAPNVFKTPPLWLFVTPSTLPYPFKSFKRAHPPNPQIPFGIHNDICLWHDMTHFGCRPFVM